MQIKSVMVDSSGTIVKKSPKLPPDLPPKKKRVATDELPNGHWLFDEPLGRNGEFGFIYLIHDTLNDKMYIGKKQFFGTGQANKGVESDWRRYTSSCKALQAVMKEQGKANFKFYVLEQYKIRGTLGYAETWSLMYCETPANKDKWYNSLVNKISWTVKEGISKKHKDRLNAILQGRPVEVMEEVNETMVQVFSPSIGSLSR